MTDERLAALKSLEESLGYHFQDITLLDHALTHRSFTNEFAYPAGKDNERLEFLGDAVLDLCVTDLLMRTFPEEPEGRLSKRRAACVNERSLADLAKGFNMGDGLLLGKGEELSGGRCKPSLLANAFEALLAAIYLDGGFGQATTFIHRVFGDIIKDGGEDLRYKDYKTLLQETVQVRFHETPRYSVVREFGPDHDKTFNVELNVADRIITSGTGKSRKEAEQAAAGKALEMLGGPRHTEPDREPGSS
jgi:ribonuclease III